VVMQTLSKAFGLAGIRLGVAYSSPEIAGLLNNLKAPYNISSPTSAIATAALEPQNLEIMQQNRSKILQQRERLLRELPKIQGIGRFLGGMDSNFLLVEILDKPRKEGGKPDNPTALAVYETMAGSRGVVVRYRGKELGCEGCLRVTVGTEKEVDRFLAEIGSVLTHIHGKTLKKDAAEEQKENNANGVISWSHALPEHHHVCHPVTEYSLGRGISTNRILEPSGTPVNVAEIAAFDAGSASCTCGLDDVKMQTLCFNLPIGMYLNGKTTWTYLAFWLLCFYSVLLIRFKLLT
jgi:Aminotransferase class I and II